MGRKKKVKQEKEKKVLTLGEQKKATVEAMAAISGFMKEKFGKFQPPDSFITPTGIRHLDAIIGGGFSSQATICLTSTPETGKSTIAYQFCQKFLDSHSTGMVIFLDVENVAGGDSCSHSLTRAELYGLNDTGRFYYEKGIYDRITVFNPINDFIAEVLEIEKNTGADIKLLVVLDSIAALPAAGVEEAEKTASLTGQKSSQIQLTLDKLKAPIALNNVTFLVIDQIRSNMKMEGKFAKAEEKTVGTFGNMKSATASTSFQHRVGQWLMMSKREEIPLSEDLGLDGWKINIFTEKNKSAASKFQVTCVFDKIHGLDKFWSEYEFISQWTPTEKRLFTNKKKTIDPFMELCVEVSGGYSRLNIVSPDAELDKDNKPIPIYQSPKGYYKKNAKQMYEEDPEFKKWFDFAVDYSIKKRIVEGLFRVKKESEELLKTIEEEIPEGTEVIDTQEVKPKGKKKPGRPKKKVLTDEPNVAAEDQNLTASPNIDNEDKVIIE